MNRDVTSTLPIATHVRPIDAAKTERAIDAFGRNTPVVCELCEHERKLTRHHLRPRSVHNRLLKRGFSRDELNTCADICRPCHNAVHRAEDNRTLADEYFTVARLREHPHIIRWVNFWSKK